MKSVFFHNTDIDTIIDWRSLSIRVTLPLNLHSLQNLLDVGRRALFKFDFQQTSSDARGLFNLSETLGFESWQRNHDTPLFFVDNECDSLAGFLTKWDVPTHFTRTLFPETIEDGCGETTCSFTLKNRWNSHSSRAECSKSSLDEISTFEVEDFSFSLTGCKTHQTNSVHWVSCQTVFGSR
jgi:hypothetical protein